MQKISDSIRRAQSPYSIRFVDNDGPIEYFAIASKGKMFNFYAADNAKMCAWRYNELVDTWIAELR